MKFGWLGLSDEEYVERLRATYQQTLRWKWPMMVGHWLILAIMLGFAITIKLFPMQRPLAPPLIGSVSSEIAYAMGLLAGHMFTMFLFLAIFATGTLITGLRTWKLLLDYHDHLHQAGLLPGDAAEKMETTTLPSPRS